MTLDWTVIITGILTFMGGGGLSSLITWRSMRQSADLENESKVVQEYKDLLNQYKEETAKARQEAEESRALLAEMSKKMHEMERQLSVAQVQISNLQLLFETARLKSCDVLDCDKRPLSKETIAFLCGAKAVGDENENEN